MELKQALVHFPALSAGMEPPAVLEVGAGTGQQASVLDAAGYEVLAIDLTTSHYRSKRVYDVVEYDGKRFQPATRRWMSFSARTYSSTWRK
jgi:protein-L-isoaspartate O-methyltransferase